VTDRESDSLPESSDPAASNRHSGFSQEGTAKSQDEVVTISLASPPARPLGPPGFSASVKERIRLLNQGYINGSAGGTIERTICTNIGM
jgi:hypothetical protein